MRTIAELENKLTEYCLEDNLENIFIKVKNNSTEYHLINCRNSKIDHEINEIPIINLNKMSYKRCCIKDYTDLIESITSKQIKNILYFINKCDEFNNELKNNINKNDLEKQVISFFSYIKENAEYLTNYYDLYIVNINIKVDLFYKNTIDNAKKFIKEKIRSKSNIDFITKKYNLVECDQKLILTTKNKQNKSDMFIANYDNENEIVETLAILFDFLEEDKEIIIIPLWAYNLVIAIFPNYFNEIYYDTDNNAHEIASKLYKESNSNDLFYSYKEAYKTAVKIDK